MPHFKYSARDNFAKLVSGAITASSKEEAAQKLKGMGYFPLNINEAYEFTPARILKKFQRVPLEDINTFTRQLFSLLKAGIPLLTSLETIGLETDNHYFKRVINDIALNIKGGLSFSEALKRHSQVFDGIYISMIRTAEASGMLVDILERLAGLIEQHIDTRSRIKAGTRYPLLAFLVLCAGFLIVVVFVIPRFANVYSQFHTTLPLPTRLLIAVNFAIKKFWYLFVLGIAGSFFGFFRFIHSKKGRPVWDNFKLKAWVFGPLMKMLTMARFTRVTAILMKSGVAILEILDLVAEASGNIIIARAITNIKESVKQGRGISEPMKVSGLFPPIVVQMVYAGEQSGRVDELLLNVADYYDRESGYMIRNLTTYIEPILIFILAVMVLVMALAIFMPMWNLVRLFKAG